MASLREQVAELKDGDRVEATFEILSYDPGMGMGMPTGIVGEPIVGVCRTRKSDFDLPNSLSLITGTLFNGQCIRQPGGMPGGWLRSIKKVS